MTPLAPDSHPPEHETLLAELLAGEIAATDARARARMESCTTCRDALRAAAPLLADLERLGNEHRTDVAAARMKRGAPPDVLNDFRLAARRAVKEELRNGASPPGHTKPPLQDRGASDDTREVGGLFQHRHEQSSEDSGRPHASHRRPRLVAWTGTWVAAASLVLAFSWLFLEAQRGPDGVPIGPDSGAPISLGDEHPVIRGIEPQGAVREYACFRWSCDRRPGWLFRVIVTDAALPDREVARSPLTSVLEWAPSESERRGWPNAIEWTVEIIEPGQPMSEVSAPLAAFRT